MELNMNTEDDTDENQSMTPNVTLIKSDFCSVYDNLCKKKKKREYEDFELRNDNAYDRTSFSSCCLEELETLNRKIDQILAENSFLRREVEYCRSEMKRQAGEIRNLTCTLEEVMKFIKYPNLIGLKNCDRDSELFPLPCEIMSKIINYLPLQDRLKMRLVSKRAKRFVEESTEEYIINNYDNVELLKYFVNLKKLTIKSSINGVLMTHVNNLSNLHTLNLVDIDYCSDESYFYIMRSNTIRHLRLENVGNLRMCFLAKMTHLESLEVVNQFSKIQFPPFLNLINLKSLVISNCEELVSCVSGFKSFINLEKLQIECYRFDIATLDFLSNMKKLKYLSLKTCKNNFEYLNISALKNLVELQYVDLQCYHIIDYTPIKYLTNLEHLFIGTGYTEEVLMMIYSTLKKLKNLYLGANEDDIMIE